MYYIDNKGTLYEKAGVDFRIRKGLQTDEGLRIANEEEIDRILNPKSESDKKAESENIWVLSEMDFVEININLHKDNDERSISTEDKWREYRKDLRNYVKDGKVIGDRPTRPENV